MATDQAAREFALLKRAIAGFMDLEGRSTRTEYFLFWIFAKLTALIIVQLAQLALNHGLLILLACVLLVLIFIPNFALFVRRLNDQGRSDPWAIALPIALLASIFSASFSHAGYMTNGDLVSAIANAALLLLAALPGTKGPNRYGPDPRIDAKPTAAEQ